MQAIHAWRGVCIQNIEPVAGINWVTGSWSCMHNRDEFGPRRKLFLHLTIHAVIYVKKIINGKHAGVAIGYSVDNDNAWVSSVISHSDSGFKLNWNDACMALLHVCIVPNYNSCQWHIELSDKLCLLGSYVICFFQTQRHTKVYYRFNELYQHAYSISIS